MFAYVPTTLHFLSPQDPLCRCTPRTMTQISPVAAVVLILISCVATEAAILCAWTKVLSDGEVHHSFLQSDPPSRRLYHSIWAPSHTLLSCSFSDNKRIIQSYISLCRGNTRDFSHKPDLHPERVIDEKEQCTSVDSPKLIPIEDFNVKSGKRLARSVSRDAGSEVTIKRRFRRGFIVPGTLWCGSGNKAPSYSDLGVFTETDKCCREHDQCQDTILSFHSKFGVFNSNIFTMSHCDCDNRFHHCLKDAQDSISDVVGYTFFNVLKMHCFEFSHRLQCTVRNWFGMCKESKMSLYAEVHPPTLYVTDTVDANDTRVNTTTATPVHTSHLLLPATTESTLSTRPSHASLITPPTSMNTPVILTSTLIPSRSPNPTLLLPDTDIAGKWCAIYKYLDECRNRILPLQRKYGFSNNDPRTMYHCNCTDRLFQSLAAYTVLSEVQTILLDHVSHTCFVLKDCKVDGSCKAIARTMLSQVETGSSGHVNQQHPLQMMRLRVRGPKLKRGTNRSARLHRLCLRLMLHKVHKSRRRLSDASTE